MFHKLIKIEYLEGTSLKAVFQDGKIIIYDVATLFDKYPQLKALKNKDLFKSGKMSSYGIRWNEDLDLEAETIYQDGKCIGRAELPINHKIAYVVSSARQNHGLSQQELSQLTGIDQADISKIESGHSNPSIATLERISNALHLELSISMK